LSPRGEKVSIGFVVSLCDLALLVRDGEVVEAVVLILVPLDVGHCNIVVCQVRKHTEARSSAPSQKLVSPSLAFFELGQERIVVEHDVDCVQLPEVLFLLFGGTSGECVGLGIEDGRAGVLFVSHLGANVNACVGAESELGALNQFFNVVFTALVGFWDAPLDGLTELFAAL